VLPADFHVTRSSSLGAVTDRVVQIPGWYDDGGNRLGV
jgi:hypothetical protein